MTAARRDLRPVEMEVIAELATATPDLLAVRTQLLAVLAAPAGSHGGGTLPWIPAVEPKTMKELLEAVRLGVLSPVQARTFVNLPEASHGVFRRLARLRSQRGGAA